MRDLDPFKPPTKTVFLTAVVLGSGYVGKAALPVQGDFVEYSTSEDSNIQIFISRDLSGDLELEDALKKLVFALEVGSFMENEDFEIEYHDRSELEFTFKANPEKEHHEANGCEKYAPHPNIEDPGDPRELIALDSKWFENVFVNVDFEAITETVHQDNSDFEVTSPQPDYRESDLLPARKTSMQLQNSSTKLFRNFMTSLEDADSNFFVLGQSFEMREWVMNVKRSNETFYENFSLLLADNMDFASMRNIEYTASGTKYDFRGKLIKVEI